ncbi:MULTISPECIES: MaoC family dehydratase [unclassified Undibacterium]|uniref:MaoC family dehydratase n=1 Tax=unclassified Undibacterium TaxID=2630295 RepID=UPI002AC98615|nr:MULTISPECIES: MaoC family dehydratase [unclassified Undibacterium]MEB0139116.1 MaoC family dehydratase [Undibacterium sp. CCC2.1]MEB0173331.1 MaoC family dehydratase [Undibacterium sp. CCC1.1]MEB0177629.1 MaoC family dehydratase [Undibacterium sp. CCC3.4]MEB0216807.1 MaoC family dehydratase [Undibacterium sp. 5I2]WPX43111.1 MaoC family dehydratase [Undibacterium sp. CCC3.4]
MTSKTYSWYFEDFIPGNVIELGQRQVSEAEIIDFAKQFDPQSFHIDKQAAQASIFGDVIASGWHTCSMIMRLVVDGFLGDSSSMGSPGIDEIRWILPVRPGDTLSVSAATLSCKASSSKPDRGVVHTMWKAVNQHGQLVCTITGMGMFGRRPPN